MALTHELPLLRGTGDRKWLGWSAWIPSPFLYTLIESVIPSWDPAAWTRWEKLEKSQNKCDIQMLRNVTFILVNQNKSGAHPLPDGENLRASSWDSTSPPVRNLGSQGSRVCPHPAVTARLKEGSS